MAELPFKNKDEWTSLMQRRAVNRNPDIDVAEGSFHHGFLSTIGEALAIQSSVAKGTAQSIPLSLMTEEECEAKFGKRVPRGKESYSYGSITISTAPGGTTIYVGDILKDDDTKQSVVFTGTSNTTYLDGEKVPVKSVDPGAGTNIAIGKRMTWSTIRPGCYATAIVAASASGNGISGGRDTETLEEWKDRISDNLANPAGHCNEAEIIAIVEDSSGRVLANGKRSLGHGVAVEKAFAFPALYGSGTCGIVYLIKREHWWESRIPTSEQDAAISDYVNDPENGLPISFPTSLERTENQDVNVDLRVSLDRASTQWSDFAPWPSYTARGSGCKVISSASSSTSFSIRTDDNDYTGETSPSAGNTIALFDRSNGKVVRKRILSVSGTGPWSLTINSSADASDTTYTPVVGQAVFPWFDALPSVIDEIGKHISRLGCGEMNAWVPSVPGDGVRRWRYPRPQPNRYNTEVTARVANDVTNNVAGVVATFLAASPSATLNNTGSFSFVFRLADVGIYKQ
jgi:hypothetical protein